MLLTILSFLLVLSVLVLIHELGHFLVAKFFGVKVEEFGFGFPPRVIGKQFGETVYSINLLPIGGFVKLYGEDDAGGGKVGKVADPTKKKGDISRAFFARPAWQRALVIVAGVAMNFVLAVGMLTYLFIAVGVTKAGNAVVIDAVLPNSPASQAGLHRGDMIISINGKGISQSRDVIAVTHANLGKDMTLVISTVSHNVETIHITPRVHYPSNEGAMGVAISPSFTTQKYPWYTAPWYATKEAGAETVMIVQGLGTTLTQLVGHGQVPKDLAGPIGIAQLTGQFVRLGIAPLLSLMVLLSLNLAVLNILPIPALDGGRFFFILVEVITRKKVHPRFEAYAHTIGMIVLLGLIVVITLHDVVRVASGQPLIPGM